MKRLRATKKEVDLWLLFGKTRHAMLQARRKELARYGISPRQAHILRIIHDLGDGATLKEVSQNAFREIPSISILVTRMVAAAQEELPDARVYPAPRSQISILASLSESALANWTLIRFGKRV